jgi:hypothetical protein
MKKITHAWLAFEAIKRLEEANLSRTNRRYADSLIQWFKRNRDGVTQGAWYPDSVIKDMANSHVLKFTPSSGTAVKFRRLPSTYLSYQYGKGSPVRKQAFTVDKNDNLPDRCESIAHSVIDHLKIQESEEKGAAVSPTDNQVALLLFMLSHYIADAHIPFHCDSRRFSEGDDLHCEMEEEWDDMVTSHYQIDDVNERFFYNPDGYPLRDLSKEQEYQSSFLKQVEDVLTSRKFILSWGAQNNNVWDFMNAVCQHSYLLSYCFLPSQYDHTNVNSANWQSLGSIDFKTLSVAVFTDAIDSIARVWFRVWRRYVKWKREIYK